jgi:hypothetical protein
MCIDDPPESAFAEHEDPRLPVRHDIVGRGLSLEQEVAAEEVAEGKRPELLAVRGIDLRKRASENDEESFRRLALLDDLRPGLDLGESELTGYRAALGLGEGREEEIGPKLTIEHPVARRAQNSLRELGSAAHRRKERAAVDREQLRIDERGDRRIARLPGHQPDLPDQRSALEHRELSPRAALGNRHDCPVDHDIEAPGIVPLPK